LIAQNAKGKSVIKFHTGHRHRKKRKNGGGFSAGAAKLGLVANGGGDSLECGHIQRWQE